MKTLWKGAISFGLVNIPVKMYVATEKKDIKFHYLHKECMSPVKYQKYCANCQRELTTEEIVRGYEYRKGNYVIINEEDLDRIPLEDTKTIDILDFVDLNQVDPIYFDKSYYLEPSQGGEKAYSLLVQAIEKTAKTAIARIIIRTKQSLAALRVKDRVLVLETIFYPDEIRPASSLNTGVEQTKLHENEIKMAVNLIENLSTDFQPEKYTNEYRSALWELVEAKIAGKEIVTPAPSEGENNVVDLLEALKASVKIAEENRQAGGKAKTRKKRKTGT
ncbi:MAG: Ku protein [Syntrophomonadaceae bacterium]|jgi:DNA end-binding protein Ku